METSSNGISVPTTFLSILSSKQCTQENRMLQRSVGVSEQKPKFLMLRSKVPTDLIQLSRPVNL